MAFARQHDQQSQALGSDAAPQRRAARTSLSPRHGFVTSPRRPSGGLPDPLRSNVERMSGFSMDDVRVHRNSSRPAQLGALAFTQGSEIHVAPGQERHLPHEAWHVVQQKQGRVAATRQMKGVGLNEDRGLEREADRFGALAAAGSGTPAMTVQREAVAGAVVQLRAAQGLLDLKADRDGLYALVPNAFTERRAILADVTARAGNLTTLDNAKRGADDLWDIWQVAHDRAEQDQPYASPNRSLANDRTAMGRYLQSFTGVAELINGNIRATKRELAAQHYATGNIPGMGAACNHDNDEGLNAFKARLRDVVEDYVQPGARVWYGGIGYAYGTDPQFKQLTAISVTRRLNNVDQTTQTKIHWTVYKADFGNLTTLRTTASRDNAIVPALIPNSGSKDGVHVTLEASGRPNSSRNPHAYGRPASRATKTQYLPWGITQNTMFASLNAENNRLITKIGDWVTPRNQRVRNGWENH